MSAITDRLRQLFEGIRDERNIAANTATRIGNAFLELLNYLDNSPYLSKEHDDETEYLLTLLAGAVIGESGQITLNPDGSITCGRIKVNGSAIFDEMVFNRQNILEGDTYFSNHGTIESVEFLDVNTYDLKMRRLYDDDTTTFQVGDVLKGVVNNLDTEGTFHTSWFRVLSVNTSDNTLKVVIYDDEDVPGGTNYPPCAAMNVARWGSATDENRQSCFYVSSTDGTFLFLQGVTQPILSDTNYGAFLGIPPQMSILQHLPINRKQPYIYARGLIVQDLIRIDYQGNPIYEIRDLGIWQDDVQYIKGKDSTSDNYYQDQVWWGGCVWRAATSLPTIGNEPRFNNADWICVSGASDINIDITSSAGEWFRAGAPFTTVLTASVYHAEMELLETEIGKQNIVWKRISTDAAGDAAWNALHTAGHDGLSLTLTGSDLPANWMTVREVAYKIEVTMPDGYNYQQSFGIRI